MYKRQGLLKAVQESVGTKEQYNGKEIFEMANSGDKKVLAGLDKFCNRLAVQIYNLQALFDPEKIAIGGGISAQPLLLELVEKHIEEMYQTGLKANSPIARPVVCLLYTSHCFLIYDKVFLLLYLKITTLIIFV